MNHPLSPTGAVLAPAPAPRGRRRTGLRRAGAVMALAVTLGVTGAACTKTEQVATNQTTTAAPATTKPAGDAGAGTGTTVGTSPGTTMGTTPSTARSTTSTTGGESTTTSAAPASTTTASTGPVSTVAGTAADAAFCAKGAEIEARLKDLDPTKDPAAAMVQYKQVFAELAAAAPPEMQADMNEINRIIQSMTGFEPAQADAEKLDAAGKRVDTWALAHCGKKFGS